MAIVSGRDSKVQIGLETTWGTAVAPTHEVPFTSESLRFIPNYIEEDALVGGKTSGRMDVSGEKVEGDVSFICKPDEYLGLILAATLGAEATAAQVGVTDAYDHAFTPVAGGTGSSLPHLTITVDRKVAIKGYVSCKIDSLQLEAAVNDYLRGTISVRGHSEETDTLASLTAPTLKAFQFKSGAITVDASNYAEVTSVRFNYSNNLENDLYTLGSGDNMVEIEPQAREITMELETLYSTTTESTRENKFKAGATADIILTFTSSEDIDTATPYTLTIDMPLCYITEASPTVGGPDRITQTLSVRATENASNEAVTITLRDAKTTDYLP